MSFLLNPFYYAFSVNSIQKYQKQTNKKNKNINKPTILLDKEEPIVTIDINFDNIQIIEDYVTNNLLVNAILNMNNTFIKRIASEKSIISEVECYGTFNNEKYSIDNLSFSNRD
uniref:Uncharacterized protein n=1 Tax=viral metagenome TaxID=1070528 RepID=A0A6C0IRR2_9ZZZZ